MLSKETSYSQARANLASILDEVVDQQQIFIVKRRNGKNVALIAEDELSSLLECVHLLRSPENASRLHRALEWSESEEAQPQTIDQLKQELGLDERFRVDRKDLSASRRKIKDLSAYTRES